MASAMGLAIYLWVMPDTQEEFYPIFQERLSYKSFWSHSQQQSCTCTEIRTENVVCPNISFNSNPSNLLNSLACGKDPWKWISAQLLHRLCCEFDLISSLICSRVSCSTWFYINSKPIPLLLSERTIYYSTISRTSKLFPLATDLSSSLRFTVSANMNSV